MRFTVPLYHHLIFSEQLFQLRFTGVLHLNFPANFLSCAKLKQLFQKYPMMRLRRSETHSTSLCLYDLICPDGDVWHIGAVQQLACNLCIAIGFSCCWQQFFIAIWFVQTATNDTSAQWHHDMICLLAIRFLSFDLICPDSDRLYVLRYDLSGCWKQFFIKRCFAQTAACPQSGLICKFC